MCEGKDAKKKKIQNTAGKGLSLRDFFDTTKPWDLRPYLTDPQKIQKYFAFVPDQFKEGQWLPLASWTMFFIICSGFYLTIDANIEFKNDPHDKKGITEEFVGDRFYSAFTLEWYYNFIVFFWMNYVSMTVVRATGFWPWITFTMCSWTVMTIRHGLCTIAPFVPSVRLLIGVLRFPVLLSASITFGIWNFILLPAISIVFLSGERRRKFIRWAFTWRLCQIHLFNIIFAYLNCVWAEPRAHPLHLGDANAGVVYFMTYISFYYLILDRIGIQLYPIFSPRTYICIFSWFLAAGICVGNYKIWNYILSTSA
jgi:hypothetical protein